MKRRPLWSAALPVLLALAIVFVVPRPAAIKPEAWRLLGIFVGAVAGLVMQPIPGGAVVLIAVTLAPIFGGLSVKQALSGYGDPICWLVMAAFFISRALIKTGLARRIALFFVRTAGRTSLGVCYALSFSDMLLATMIPSNAARSGGVILPIVRSICELYGSLPGRTAALLGSFLMTAVYQSVCVTAAMFLTGQASNPQAAKAALDHLHYPVTWMGWALAAIVPGLCSLAIVPLVVFRMNPPQIRRTPEASEFAARELEAMGPMKRQEIVTLAVFVAVCAGWVTSPLHGLEIAVTALAGAAALLVTGVLSWEDVKNERAAWDIFVWYGGLLMLGQALNDAGLADAFARAVAAAVRPPRLAGAVCDCAPGLLLFPLRVREHYDAHPGDVHAVRGGAGGHGRTQRLDGVRFRLLRQPLGGADQLRHHALADVLRARLRQPRPMVEGGRGGVGGQHRDLVFGRLPLVESSRAVVESSAGGCRHVANRIDTASAGANHVPSRDSGRKCNKGSSRSLWACWRSFRGSRKRL